MPNFAVWQRNLFKACPRGANRFWKQLLQGQTEAFELPRSSAQPRPGFRGDFVTRTF